MTTSSTERWRRLLEGSLGIPATEGNHLEVLRDGAEIFPRMLEAIRGAQYAVDLLTFVYWTGEIAHEFAAALCERAEAGVRCRVVLDSIGARHLDGELIQQMERAGVLIHWFRPLTDPEDLKDPGHRTHRKVLICDEEIGFAGGVGIAEEWDGDSADGSGWRETQLEVRGPAVDGLRAAFLDDWLESGHPLVDDADRFPEQPTDGASTAMVVRGESEQGWSDIAMSRRMLFTQARERIRVTTPYFAPDDGLFEILCDGARRGVQVQVLLPGPNNDKEVARLAAESREAELLACGIEVFHFAPTMLHAKVTTVDGEVGVVGSANLNHRSLMIDEEVDVVALDPELVAVLDAHTDRDLERADRLTEDDLDDPVRKARRPLRMMQSLVDRWT